MDRLLKVAQIVISVILTIVGFAAHQPVLIVGGLMLLCLSFASPYDEAGPV